MHEYRGALHVHTAYGDGSGSMADVIAAAAEAGLDFLAVTDHWSQPARADGWEGWHGRLLTLVGAELHARRGTVHYLALGATHVPPPQADLREATLDRYVRDHGGHLFLAHPQGVPRTPFTPWSRPWSNWPHTRVTGIELWSYMHDWLERFRLHRMLHFHRRHADEITGPNPVVLDAWDRLTQQRRVAALAGLDNHARTVPVLRLRFLPYEALFGTVSTHVLLDAPLTGEAGADAPAVVSALAAGRAFLANDALADPASFRFEALWNDGAVGPGAAVPHGEDVLLRVQSPAAAEWRLTSAGRVLAVGEGRTLECRLRGGGAPGAFHVQGRRHGRFWLVTNPIYVEPPPAPAPSPAASRDEAAANGRCRNRSPVHCSATGGSHRSVGR